MPRRYEVDEMNSAEFRTLLTNGWQGPQQGAAWVTYEPWLCDYLLSQKCKNRPISPTELAKVKEALADDRWLLTGETLIFTADFGVMDGQHRLTAGRDTKIPFTNFTIWGVHLDAFPGIDIGKKRSGADQLAANNVADYSAMAAGLRVFYRLEKKAMRSVDVILPDHQIMPYLTAHKEIRYSLTYGQRAHRFLPPSIGSALHYAMRERGKSLQAQGDTAPEGAVTMLADTLFSDLIDGELLSKRDPVYILRELLSQRKPEGRRARQNADTKTKADLAAQVIEVWNALRLNKSLTIAYLRSVSERPFPEML